MLTDNLNKTIDSVRRAFAEFLRLPTFIIAGCLSLAGVSYALDQAEPDTLKPLRDFLKSHIFGEPQATRDLLAAIAGGIIALTSITVSLLLVAVQQAAGSMTSEVFDQFLRRHHNQIYFGFFVGLSLYSLVTLATVTQNFNPVFGGTFAFFGAVIALYLLILLFYTTINQMRPVEIVEAIHDHALQARTRQLDLIRRTRRASSFAGNAKTLVITESHGFVTRINADFLAKAVQEIDCEIVLKVSIGSFVAHQQVIAEIKSQSADNFKGLADAVITAVKLERQRDITVDAAYAVEQLEMIAWTSISTSKSNPAPGKRTIFALRDLLAGLRRKTPKRKPN